VRLPVEHRDVDGLHLHRRQRERTLRIAPRVGGAALVEFHPRPVGVAAAAIAIELRSGDVAVVAGDRLTVAARQEVDIPKMDDRDLEIRREPHGALEFRDRVRVVACGQIAEPETIVRVRDGRRELDVPAVRGDRLIRTTGHDVGVAQGVVELGIVGIHHAAPLENGNRLFEPLLTDEQVTEPPVGLQIIRVAVDDLRVRRDRPAELTVSHRVPCGNVRAVLIGQPPR
jgi:hypothetical protein